MDTPAAPPVESPAEMAVAAAAAASRERGYDLHPHSIPYHSVASAPIYGRYDFLGVTRWLAQRADVTTIEIAGNTWARAGHPTCYAMLCYAMPCHAMPCHAMPCYAMLCYSMLCYAMLCYAVLCYAMLGRVRAIALAHVRR